MYLLYAPQTKFGNIPPGHPLISDEARFFQNVAFTGKQYWKKVHCQNGCRDITPRFLRKLRQKRKLKTVLIFATGGIGDSMWAMPFARFLKEKYPQIAIVIVTEKKNAGVWRNVPYISATVENAFWNVNGILRNADEAFDFGGIATVLKEEMRLDPIEATFKLAEYPLPKEKEKCRPMLVVTIDEGKRTEAMLKDKGIDIKKDKIISLGVEASTSNRSWPFDYTKELSRVLIEQGFKVIWLGKSIEQSELYQNEETKKIGVVNLIHETNIRQAMAVISLSDVFVGPNSGLMVIATSLNIPTIGLFGAFNPKLRAKFYERFSYIWGKASCSPCGEHWTECRKGHPAPCMKMIFPEQVYNEIKNMLRQYPRQILSRLPIE